MINPNGMERASKLIRGLKFPGDEVISAADLACAAWPEAVGKRLAAHTRAARMVRGRLVVEVEDAIWKRQLFTLSRHILSNLERSLGPGCVEDVEFRVVPRRREPHRAQQATPAQQATCAQDAAPARPRGPAFTDEADDIADPVLRGIYKASRKRAQA